MPPRVATASLLAANLLEAPVDWVGHGLQNRCAESSFVGGFDSRALPNRST